MNSWEGIVNDSLIASYVLPNRLNDRFYLILIEQVLSELLQIIPIAICNRMWFQHDGEPAHFTTDVRNYLNATLGTRWIERGVPDPWPPRSPDLSSLKYILWGHLKILVYVTAVASDEDIVARISVGVTHDVFRSAR